MRWANSGFSSPNQSNRLPSNGGEEEKSCIVFLFRNDRGSVIFWFEFCQLPLRCLSSNTANAETYSYLCAVQVGIILSFCSLSFNNGKKRNDSSPINLTLSHFGLMQRKYLISPLLHSFRTTVPKHNIGACVTAMARKFIIQAKRRSSSSQVTASFENPLDKDLKPFDLLKRPRSHCQTFSK